MPRGRHVRIALRVTVITITIVFILSFFPGTPSSVYTNDNVDLSAIKPYDTPLALQSSQPVATPEATITAESHSSTYGKGAPVLPGGQSSQEKSHDASTDSEKEDAGKSSSEKSHSGKTSSGTSDTSNTAPEKEDNGKSSYAKPHSGGSSSENTYSGSTKSGKTDTGKSHSGSHSGKTSSSKESQKELKETTEKESDKSEKEEEEEDTEPEEKKRPDPKIENAGWDKPNTFKKPKPYSHDRHKEVAPPLTSHSFTKVILNSEETGPSRLGCPAVASSRYKHLLPGKKTKNSQGEVKRKFYFALDMYECQSVLPTLMGAIVEAIRFLGPENCALSIVEGRSRDWTYDILAEVGEAVEAMGVKFNLTTNPVDPLAEGGDRIISLAELRNQALQPLYDNPQDYTDDSIVLFINDINPCVDDILELAHQLDIQKADMTCSMDWQSRGTVFYDFWVSRAINGDSFFEIPQNGAWDFSQNMFWNEPKSKERMEAMQPVQVYACWNGMVVFKTKPLLKNGIRFRGQRENECYMGEPTYLCKDFWAIGHGRVAIVPAVNVAYTLTEALATKEYRGYVDEVVDYASKTDVPELIDWQKEPPAMVKCAKTWDKPSWVPPL